MKQLRLLYALGPGDVVGSYRHWRAGQDVLSQTSRTFSGQFFDFCKRRGHSAWAISYCTPAAKIVDGSLIVENRPKPAARDGLSYHVSQLRYAVSIIASALRWRADAVIVDSGTTHWALLAPLKLAGIKVVGSLHNVIWPKGYKPSKPFKRLVLASDAWFWRHVADAVIAVSPEGEKRCGSLLLYSRASRLNTGRSSISKISNQFRSRRSRLRRRSEYYSLAGSGETKAYSTSSTSPASSSGKCLGALLSMYAARGARSMS
jgi:hypothetical protein